MLFIFPAGFLSRDVLLCVTFEANHSRFRRLRFGALTDRVDIVADQLSRFVARVPRFGQRHFAGGAEAGLALFAGRRRRVPKGPRPIAVLVNVEPQSPPSQSLSPGLAFFTANAVRFPIASPSKVSA